MAQCLYLNMNHKKTLLKLIYCEKAKKFEKNLPPKKNTYYVMSIQSGRFLNFSGLVGISELYSTFYVNSGTYFLHFRDLCLCDLQFCKEWG